MEKFYLQWRNHLIFKTADEAIVLNYLYCIGISTMIDQITKEQILEYVKTISSSDFQRLGDLSPDQKQWLEQHKAHIIKKIKEFGNYDGLEISAIQEANIEATELLLKIILKKDDIQVISVVGQRELQSPVVGGRDIRLDILAKDSTGKHYNVEVQKKPEGAHIRRARFNSSMMYLMMVLILSM